MMRSPEEARRAERERACPGGFTPHRASCKRRPAMNSHWIERAMAVATRGPRGALQRVGNMVHVGIEPEEVRMERDEASALDAFARAVDAWRDTSTGSEPHAFGWITYDALRRDEPGSTQDLRARGDA